MWLPIDINGNPLTDSALLAMIGQGNQAMSDISNNDIGVIQGEGRRLEYTSQNRKSLRNDILAMLREAKRRGLPIGDYLPDIGGLAVEIG